MDEAQHSPPALSVGAPATDTARDVVGEMAVAPATNGATSPASKITWVSTFALAPVALGLLTAMFFLTGRAYWLGYLNYFHLESTMFSDDLSNQATRSVSAWLYAFQEASGWIRSHFIATLLIALFLPIGVFLILCFAAAIGRATKGIGRRIVKWAEAKTRGARSHRTTRLSILFVARWFQPPAFARSFMRGFTYAYATAYSIYLAFWVVSLVIVLLVGPFDAVGRSVAAKDMEERFATSAAVKIPDGEGQTSSYRMILCTPRYCALFDGKKAVTVTASSVTRADSPPPGHTR